MNQFIGHKFGVEITFSSKYNTVPWTGGGWRLIRETAEDFTAIGDEGTIVTHSKRLYTYEVLDKVTTNTKG
jgi:hypothetical protein